MLHGQEQQVPGQDKNAEQDGADAQNRFIARPGGAQAIDDPVRPYHAEDQHARVENVHGQVIPALFREHHPTVESALHGGQEAEDVAGQQIGGQPQGHGDHLRDNGDGTSTVIAATPNYRIGTVVSNASAKDLLTNRKFLYYLVLEILFSAATGAAYSFTPAFLTSKGLEASTASTFRR